MDVSLNGGTPKSSILIGFSIINYPFWGTPIFGNTQINPIFRETTISPIFQNEDRDGSASRISRVRVSRLQWNVRDEWFGKEW